MSDPYEVLGVVPEADAEEIKRQYRFQLHALHPDKFPASQKAQAEERAKVINAAYAVLSDPAARRDYDRQRGRARAASPVAPTPPPPSSPPTSSPAPPPPPELGSRRARRDFEALDGDMSRVMHQGHLRFRGLLPGKTSVAVDIPRAERRTVTLRELLESKEWEESTAKIPLALGKDVYGKAIIADLAAMPHCLIAGATGSGKSVCINSIIASLMYKFTPEQLRLVMVDPEVVELQVYNELPHLVVPVVTDPKKVLLALRWVIDEMMKRYELFARTGVRNVSRGGVSSSTRRYGLELAWRGATAPGQPPGTCGDLVLKTRTAGGATKHT